MYVVSAVCEGISDGLTYCFFFSSANPVSPSVKILIVDGVTGVVVQSINQGNARGPVRMYMVSDV